VRVAARVEEDVSPDIQPLEAYSIIPEAYSIILEAYSIILEAHSIILEAYTLDREEDKAVVNIGV
jgi:hypothetical protein